MCDMVRPVECERCLNVYDKNDKSHCILCGCSEFEEITEDEMDHWDEIFDEKKKE